jgi:hypothetical protein
MLWSALFSTLSTRNIGNLYCVTQYNQSCKLKIQYKNNLTFISVNCICSGVLCYGIVLEPRQPSVIMRLQYFDSRTDTQTDRQTDRQADSKHVCEDTLRLQRCVAHSIHRRQFRLIESNVKCSYLKIDLEMEFFGRCFICLRPPPLLWPLAPPLPLHTEYVYT